MEDFTLPEWRSNFRARITGQETVGTLRRYYWVEQTHDPDDGDTKDDGNPREGSATSAWALELNNADVPDDTLVTMRVRGVVQGFPVYEFAAAGPPGDPGPPGTGGAITVKEVDNVPTITGVTTITTNQAQGLVVSGTTPTANMSIADAGPTQTGVVNKTTQSFAGAKVIPDGLTVGVAGGGNVVKLKVWQGVNVVNDVLVETGTVTVGGSVKANLGYEVGTGFGYAPGGTAGTAVVNQFKSGLYLAGGPFAAVTNTPPATSTSAGAPGTFAYDGNFLYVCVATNTWRRTNVTTF